MSRNTYPTRRTRIHPKGQQAPLEGRAPHRDTGANKGSICRYNMLDSLLKASPLRAGERPSTECVEGALCELRLHGVLGSLGSSLRRVPETSIPILTRA